MAMAMGKRRQRQEALFITILHSCAEAGPQPTGTRRVFAASPSGGARSPHGNRDYMRLKCSSELAMVDLDYLEIDLCLKRARPRLQAAGVDRAVRDAGLDRLHRGTCALATLHRSKAMASRGVPLTSAPPQKEAPLGSTSQLKRSC